MVVILGLIIWFLVLIFLQHIQSEYADAKWMQELPTGSIVKIFYGFSALLVASCIIQKKKFGCFKWSHARKTEKHQAQLLAFFEKMNKEKQWTDGPDLMEYDSDKREIRLMNNNPNNLRTYYLPPQWEESLMQVADNLYYGYVVQQQKRKIIFFRYDDNK